MQTLLNTIDALQEQYLNVLEDVCNIESPTLDKAGVDACGAYFIRMAEQHGWQVDIAPQTGSGDAVCITMNADVDAAPFTASAHLDTVFPKGLFGAPPVRRDAVNMYGPGVMDCKGGAVAAFMAMDALERCGFRKRPVQLILQSDEENSSVSSGKDTIRYMVEKARGSVAFFNLEGHKSNTAVLVRKGILRYKITVRGVALHSSRCAEAANAICEAAHKIIRLEEMKDPDGLTCNCGVITGGTVPNTVAEECSFFADIRFASREQLERARALVKEVVENTAVAGCSAVCEEFSFRPAMEMSETNRKLLETINGIYAESGLPQLEGRLCLSGSDAAYITEEGIPCLDNLGTEGTGIHSVNEYITLASLAESAKRIAAVAYAI